MIPLGAIPAHHATRLGQRAAVIHDEAALNWFELEVAANKFRERKASALHIISSP